MELRDGLDGLLLLGGEQRAQLAESAQRNFSFQGCLGNKDAIFGRGRLVAERIFLRLERRDGRVNALCSANGEAWFTVGQVEFSVEDPVEVGLHAIGSIVGLVDGSAQATQNIVQGLSGALSDKLQKRKPIAATINETKAVKT